MKRGENLINEVNAAKVEYRQCAFWWLGQHGFILKIGDTVCYVDAYLSPSRLRKTPPLLRPEEAANANAVLGSHDHLDHIDRKAWPGIAKASPGAMFVVPELIRNKVSSELGIPAARFLGVDREISIETAGLKITGVPAAHEFLEQDEETGLHPSIGFVIEGNGVTVYHAGDTCIYEGMHEILRRWKFDIVFLPINGRDAKRLLHDIIGNMTYQEAADLAGSLRPGLVVPAHFDMFAGNLADPRLFVDYMSVKYPGISVMKPSCGIKAIAGVANQRPPLKK